MTIENAKWLIELLIGGGLLTFLWKGNRVLNRIWDIFQEYPPHSHVGNLIKYPVGMEPGKTVEMETSKTARA